jgi:hypothetical protein
MTYIAKTGKIPGLSPRKNFNPKDLYTQERNPLSITTGTTSEVSCY